MSRIELNPNTLLPFTDQDYQAPMANDVRALLTEAGLAGADAAKLIGVDGRTIRRWCGAERSIPYSAWRLLLICTGRDRDGVTAANAAAVDTYRQVEAMTATKHIELTAEQFDTLVGELDRLVENVADTAADGDPEDVARVPAITAVIEAVMQAT